jgi:hypothetical protein
LKKSLRVLAASLIVLAGVCLLATVYVFGLSDKNAGERDFISYWAAGHLLVRGQNPYDFQAVRALELAAGRNPAELVLMMRNPPLAFFMVLPLGFAGPKTALIAWLFTSISALCLASFLIWWLNGRPDSLFNYFGFGFAPVLACLMAGQFGIFLLLGVVLFLALYRNWPFFAGAALLFCALKPHFFVPFGVALLPWCLMRKSGYRILAGACVAIAASSAFAYMLDPHAWSQYSQMVRTGGALNEVVPKLSAELRLLIDPRAVWIQFVPEAIACVWAAWYFWVRRASWDWMDHGLVMLLVGAVCTPYGFLPDESLLLPAILAGVFRGAGLHRSLWPLAVIAGAALVEVMMGAEIVSRAYLWTTPAWLCWYLYATGKFTRQPAIAMA